MDRLRRLAKQPFVVLPLAAALVLAGWVFLRAGDTTDSDVAAGNQVIEATLASASETLSAEGTIAYAESADLAFTASGTVTAVHVEAGQAVAAGDVLAEIDAPELEADVAAAETDVAEAEARLADDVASGASDAQVAADESSLAIAQDRLADAEEALAGTRLVAPFDGAVSTVDLVAGEELGDGGTSATSLSGSGTGSGQSSSTLGADQTATGAGAGSTASTHIQVVSDGRFVVEVGFGDTEVTNVSVGQTATISLSSSTSGAGPGVFPGGFGGGGFALGGDAATIDRGGDEPASGVIDDVAPATGEVTELSSIADASSGVARYPATVAFTDDSGDYHAGATVLVELTYGDTTEVVQVPVFAVSTDGDESTVTVRTDAGDETRVVTTGDTTGTMITITEGLAAGEQVVVAIPGVGGAGGAGGAGGQRGGFAGGGGAIIANAEEGS